MTVIMSLIFIPLNDDSGDLFFMQINKNGFKVKDPETVAFPCWCREPESNRYGYHYPRDFKSRASASSAIPA